MRPEGKRYCEYCQQKVSPDQASATSVPAGLTTRRSLLRHPIDTARERSLFGPTTERSPCTGGVLSAPGPNREERTGRHFPLYFNHLRNGSSANSPACRQQGHICPYPPSDRRSDKHPDWKIINKTSPTNTCNEKSKGKTRNRDAPSVRLNDNTLNFTAYPSGTRAMCPDLSARPSLKP